MANWIKARLDSVGPAGRLGLLAGVILLVAIVGSTTSVGRDAEGARSDLSGLVDGKRGKVVVDTRGRPIKGPDGKPLRVAKDGRTLLDSKGRPLRDAQGEPLRITRGGRLPEAARRQVEPTGRAGRPASKRPARRPRPGRRPGPGRERPPRTPSGPPLTATVLHHDAVIVNALGAAMGISSTPMNDGEVKDLLATLADHVNSRGGIGGRPLRLEGLVLEVTTPGDYTDRVCGNLEDANPRSEVLLGIRIRPADLLECLAGLDIVALDSYSLAAPTSTIRTYPQHYFAPGGIAADRVAGPYVAGLQQAGFFHGAKKVGVLMPQGPGWDEAWGALNTALGRAGFGANRRVPYVSGTATSGYSDVMTRARQAAVHFRLNDVTHVVGYDAAGLTFMLLMQAAEGQQYRPRYGLNSTHAPNTIASQATVNDYSPYREQLKGRGGAVGIGWTPIFDVAADGEPRSRMANKCRRILHRAGVTYGNRSWFGEYTAISFCDSVLALRKAVNRSGDASSAGIRAGFDSLGGAHQSALNLSTWLAGDRHDGAVGARILRYHDSCKCMRYEGSTFAM